MRCELSHFGTVQEGSAKLLCASIEKIVSKELFLLCAVASARNKAVRRIAPPTCVRVLSALEDRVLGLGRAQLEQETYARSGFYTGGIPSAKQRGVSIRIRK